MGTEKIELIAELKDLVSGKMQEITAQVNRLEGSLKSAGSAGSGGFWDMNNSMVGSVTVGNLLASGIQQAGSAMVGLAKDSLIAYGNMEQFQTSLTTMFKGNRDEADALIVKLQQFAKTTPFELTEIQEATKMMIAYGSTSSSVVNEMKMLGDISSGVGAPLKDISYLYGTLRMQGRAYGMDIRQFAGRGIPIYEALAKVMKINKDEVTKYVEKGKVGFKEVEQALASMVDKGGQFAGMMENQSKTLLGSASNLSDAFGQLKVELGSTFSDISKDFVAMLTGMLSEMTTALGKFNRLNQDFKKGKALEFSLMERLSPETMTHFGVLQNIIDKSVEVGGKGEAQAKQQKALLENYLLNISKQYQADQMLAEISGEGKPDANKYLREVSLISSAIRKLNSIKTGIKDETDKTGGKGPSELEKVAAANKPTQIHINIENLVKGLTNIVHNNTAEAMELTEEQVARALISAVNDIAVAELK